MNLKIKTVIEELLKLYPLQKQTVWDASGIINKSFQNQTLQKILICADLNNSSLQKAIENKANLIISHHPLSLDLKKDKDLFIKRTLLELKKHHIVLCVLHTNFDLSKNGLIESFCYSLNYHKWSVCNFDKGLFSIAVNDHLQNFCNALKEHEFIDYIKMNELFYIKNPLIKRVLFGLGSYYSAAIEYPQKIKKYDLFVTGDLKWSSWVHAENHMINVIDIGHKIEAVFISQIRLQLKKIFKATIDSKILYNLPILKMKVI
ncbi:Nif3-like dinuclear metal center hexameric protein [[Mycoplasma] testudinis]|uniref:Nif3-like dinuclear metal center hexameric protein n=1 Tax=[Mycoplasma] testudinis TaxID=33924 RepID=UPI0004840E27|nr:Nif3-like dinuclear metal center hexameric protein [[Mycoplasma] testudinis]